MKNPFKDLFKKKNKGEDAPKPGITGAKKKTSFFDKSLSVGEGDSIILRLVKEIPFVGW